MTQQYWWFALLALRFASEEPDTSFFVRRPKGQHRRDGPGNGHRLPAHCLALGCKGGVVDIPRPALSGTDCEAVCEVVPHNISALLRGHFGQLALALWRWELLERLELVSLDPPLLRDVSPAGEFTS